MDEQITADKLIRFLTVAPDELKQKFIDELSEKMKGWECTIAIYSDKETVSEIAKAEKEFAEGKGIEWVPGTYMRSFTKEESEVYERFIQKNSKLTGINIFDVGNAYDLINLFADESTIKDFPLYDIFYVIGMKILDYRLFKRLSHEELAELLEIEKDTIIKLEDCEYNPTIEELWRISKKTGLKFDIKIGANNDK